MVTRWKKWGSLLVLFLCFYLTLAGCVGTWYAIWGLIPRSLGPELVFQSDYQDTAYFRREISNYFYEILYRLENWDDSEPWQQASEDPNLLYWSQLRVGTFSVTYTNTAHDLSLGLPEGYNFLLTYEDGKAAILKDGEALDIYGSGYYTRDSQWDLPGYANREVKLGGTAVIYMAVPSRPIDTGSWEPVWSIKQVVTYARYGYLGLFGVWAGALLCLTLTVTLRKARREARADLAARTAKLCFEAKLALAVLPAVLCWQLFIVGFFWGFNAYAAVLGVVMFFCYPVILYLAGCDLRHNRQVWKNSLCLRLFRRGGAAAREGAGVLSRNREKAARLLSHVWFEWILLALAAVPIGVILVSLLFWDSSLRLLSIPIFAVGAALYMGLWYLVICYFRFTPKPWRNSFCARLLGGLRRLEHARPFRQRFLLRMAAAMMGVVLLALPAFPALFHWCYDGTALSSPAALLLALLLTLLLLSPLAWLLDRVWVLLRDLCQLLDQLAVLRAGATPAPLVFPEGSDLGEAAGDLNGLQDGLQSAVEDRMKSERMKVELIANVSHDLKTPLTSVVSYAELLREEEDLPPHVRDYIRILNDKARRLQVMVQDVFEVSKAASGELPLRLERLDLCRLLAQTLADMDEAITQSGLQLRTTLPGAPVWITADGDRLYRVFQNLLQNALQYALAGSRVYVSLEVQAGWAEASIKNTSREELPSGVDFTARFVRGDTSRTDGGSGLGLAIASSFAAACGGSLLVETDADLFTARVRFPLAESGSPAP